MIDLALGMPEKENSPCSLDSYDFKRKCLVYVHAPDQGNIATLCCEGEKS